MAVFFKYIQDAWLGWKNYTDSGKLAALLLAALLFLWFSKQKQKNLSFMLYTSIIAACCILPVTAALLMIYQSRFYDYEWIWSLVPATAATAYGAVLFLAEQWDGFKAAKWRQGVPVTIFLLVVLLLSGGLGKQPWDQKTEAAERKRAYEVLARLMEICPDGDICLWAPQEVMAYAREMDGRIRLPYGRNMWEDSLNGYAYDTYDDTMIELYRWMEQTSEEDGIRDVKIPMDAYVQWAQDAGVDCIMLPADADLKAVREMGKVLGMKARRLEGYWIFYGRAD